MIKFIVGVLFWPITMVYLAIQGSWKALVMGAKMTWFLTFGWMIALARKVFKRG